MKKIYNSPATLIVKLHVINHMMQLSLNPTETINGENMSNYDQNVKSNSSNYNVWNDDWSE